MIGTVLSAACFVCVGATFVIYVCKLESFFVYVSVSWVRDRPSYYLNGLIKDKTWSMLVWAYQCCPSKMSNSWPLPQVCPGRLVALRTLSLQIFLINLSDLPIGQKMRRLHSSALFADTGKSNLSIYLGGPARARAPGHTHPPSKHHWQVAFSPLSFRLRPVTHLSWDNFVRLSTKLSGGTWAQSLLRGNQRRPRLVAAKRILPLSSPCIIRAADPTSTIVGQSGCQ